MSSRAAGFKHFRLSAVSSLFLRSSNCLWGSTNRPIAQVLGREREAEVGKGYGRIYKSGWPDSSLKRTGKSCVIERKMIENLQEKVKDVDFSHEPHLCTSRMTIDDQEYFSVFTLDQDLNFSPKYDIYPPIVHYKFSFCRSSGGLVCYVSYSGVGFFYGTQQPMSLRSSLVPTPLSNPHLVPQRIIICIGIFCSGVVFALILNLRIT